MKLFIDIFSGLNTKSIANYFSNSVEPSLKLDEKNCFKKYFCEVSLCFSMFHNVSKVDFQILSKYIQYWYYFEALFARSPNVENVF